MQNQLKADHVHLLEEPALVFSAKELGLIVRKVRKTQNLTQDDLAGLANTGRRFISDLENGKGTVQLDKAIHVLSTLGVIISIIKKW